MYHTTQTNYQNNKRCNHCGSCWRYSNCIKNHNVTYRTKSSGFDCGTFSKGLVQSLKSKITNIQNERFKLKNNRNPSMKQQKDYYCPMLRKISTLERKLQNLEDLLLTHLDYETERALNSRDSKTISLEYLNFQGLIRSLLNLANKLKAEMVYRKHNMQCSNKNSSEIYNKILALESELEDFSSYLKYLQNNSAKVFNLREASSQEECRQFDGLEGNFKRDNVSKTNCSGKKYNPNKKPVVNKSKNKPLYSNKTKQGFQNRRPVSVNFVHISNSYDSLPLKCQCRICHNLSETYISHQNGSPLKVNHSAEKPKCKKVQDKSDCSCYVSNSARKKWRLRNKKKPKYDEYKINDNLSLYSCSTFEHRVCKNDHDHTKETQLFPNSVGSQFWCTCPKNNKDCSHRTQRTFIRRGKRAKPFYNAFEISCLQPYPNRSQLNKIGNENHLQHGFEQNLDLPIFTDSDLEFGVGSFEEITTKHIKPKQKAAKGNQKYLKCKPKEFKYSRPAQNKSLTNDIVYYEVSPDAAKKFTKGINHKKTQGFTENKTNHYTNNNLKKRSIDYLTEQESLGENKNSYDSHVKANHNQLERIKPFQSKNQSIRNFKKNKLREVDNSSNISESESEVSSKNENSNEGLQFLVYNKNSKLKGLYKISNKAYIDQNILNLLIKQKGGTSTENHHQLSEELEGNLEKKSWKTHQRKRNKIENKESNGSYLEVLGENHNYYESRKARNVRDGENSSDSLESVHLTDLHYYKYGPTNKENKTHADLVSRVNHKGSSSSNKSSSLRKFVDKLNDMENDVCDKCIVKEKKIKVSPHNLKKFNCKNRVKIIIKKEVIRCSDCTSKLNDNICDIPQQNSKSQLNQILKNNNDTVGPIKKSNAYDNTILDKKENNKTNTYFQSYNERNVRPLINTTKKNGMQFPVNTETVSIFQTNLDQDNIFNNQLTKLPGLQNSSTHFTAPYTTDLENTRKSTNQSNEPLSKVRTATKSNSRITSEANNKEISVNVVNSNSYLLNQIDKETKYLAEEKPKSDTSTCLLMPPKISDTLNRSKYSKNLSGISVKSKDECQKGTVDANFNESNPPNKLYNDQSEIIHETSHVRCQENIPSYSNNVDHEINVEKSHNKVTTNAIQNQNKDLINLVTKKSMHKNELEQHKKPNLVKGDQFEEKIILHNMSKPKHKNRNTLKDLSNNCSPLKKRNKTLRNNNFVTPPKTFGLEGYNYSNKIPQKQLLNSKNHKYTTFLKKNQHFDKHSKCSCISSSSLSKVSSFTPSSCCNLCVSKRVGLRKPLRPTLNVGRRLSKPLKYWQIHYSRPPSRTKNYTKKPIVDYKNLTQTQYAGLQPSTAADVLSECEFKDSSNRNNKFITTATSESSFSIVNWAKIAQKLKDEKH